jgi:hypothetical protein
MPRVAALLQGSFYLLPGLVGYFLAACGLSAVFLTNELKRLENHRTISIIFAVIIILVGLAAVVSDSAQRYKPREPDFSSSGKSGR